MDSFISGVNPVLDSSISGLNIIIGGKTK